MSRAAIRVPPFALLAWLIACAPQIDVIAIRDVPTGGSAPPDAATTPPPPTACPYEVTPLAADAGGPTALAPGTWAQALCSCDAVTVSGRLATTAASSGAASADVGSNGELDVEGARIEGSLTVAGEGGLGLGNGTQLEVLGDLRVLGPFEGALAGASVMGDAAVGGRIDLQSLTVGGELVQPAGAERLIASPSPLRARSAEVAFAPPCACERAGFLDVPGLVAAALPAARALPSASPARLDVECGPYLLPGSHGTSLRVVAERSAALYVEGDLSVQGELILDTEPGAALDLFIAGNLSLDGALTLASGTGGPVRVHVGGSGTLLLPAGGELRGVLYAPDAELVSGAPLIVHGALFVRRVAASADLTVHYAAP